MISPAIRCCSGPARSTRSSACRRTWADRKWAKREDCNSGLAFGGNKTRKLEYLVPEALAQGADTLVSIGGVQSNHTRQVAAVAARLGLRAVLVQESWVNWPDSVNDRVGNILLSRIMGANVRLVDADFGIGFKNSWERAIEDVRMQGATPYPIPAGASDHRLGGLGFANWAYEVQQQEQQLGVFFDTIIVCSVTGSTHAGMIAGFARQARPRRVIGIDASAKLAETRAQVEKIARNTAALIGLGRDLRDDEITVLPGWAGDHYGIPVKSTLDAIRLTGGLEGMIIDPVYEGNASTRSTDGALADLDPELLERLADDVLDVEAQDRRDLLVVAADPFREIDRVAHGVLSSPAQSDGASIAGSRLGAKVPGRPVGAVEGAGVASRRREPGTEPVRFVSATVGRSTCHRGAWTRAPWRNARTPVSTARRVVWSAWSATRR